LRIKLVIEISLHYNARPKKYQISVKLVRASDPLSTLNSRNMQLLVRYAFYPCKYQNDIKVLKIHPVGQLQPFTSKARVSSHASPCGFSGVYCGTGAGLSLSTLVLTRYSTKALY